MKKEQPDTAPIKSRPYIYTLLCITLYVYSGVMLLIFLTALIYSDWITGVIRDYFAGELLKSGSLLLLGISGLLLHMLLLAATLMLWRMKRLGYYLMTVAFTLLVAIPFMAGFGSWFSALVYAILIILFSIYFRKLS